MEPHVTAPWGPCRSRIESSAQRHRHEVFRQMSTDSRDRGIPVDEEATGWGFHPKQVAFLHPLMQMVGGDSRWQLRPVRWRRHPIDRDAVGIRPRCLGDGVAARDRPVRAA